jgi:hypothetical protein
MSLNHELIEINHLGVNRAKNRNTNNKWKTSFGTLFKTRQISGACWAQQLKIWTREAPFSKSAQSCPQKFLLRSWVHHLSSLWANSGHKIKTPLKVAKEEALSHRHSNRKCLRTNNKSRTWTHQWIRVSSCRGSNSQGSLPTKTTTSQEQDLTWSRIRRKAATIIYSSSSKWEILKCLIPSVKCSGKDKCKKWGRNLTPVKVTRASRVIIISSRGIEAIERVWYGWF